MRSLSPSDWQIGMLLAATCMLAGCEREARGFNDHLAPPPSTNIRMTGLQAGAPSTTHQISSPYGYNAYAISQGKRLFDWYNCSGCHAHGGGDSGPALMDDRWIYGNAPQNIFASVVEGRPNGMPAFGGKLSSEQVWQLVAYVEALNGQLSRDALPARDDHQFDKPGEQSLPRQPAVLSTSPPPAGAGE